MGIDFSFDIRESSPGWFVVYHESVYFFSSASDRSQSSEIEQMDKESEVVFP